MGVYSWLDCITKKPVKCGKAVNVYVLIPAEFGGGTIKETCYNGYGDFGGCDIYELVAEWNRDKITDKIIDKLESLEKPQRENFCGLWFFEAEEMQKEGKTAEEIKEADEAARDEHYTRALNRYNYEIQMLNDFRNGLEDDEMIAKYGEDYLREIGINLACYDKDNKHLAYPIKITHDAGAIYEDCKPSKRDPNQGCD